MYGPKAIGLLGLITLASQVRWIQEAYTDANKLVNLAGVNSGIDWNSASALEYLGPSALNKDQQSQIQAVLANVATVKDGAAWWTPNWIRIRCDDPLRRCSKCVTPQEDEDQAVVVAYARNPAQTGQKYPDISFCPPFYGLRNLDNAMAYGSGFSNAKNKFDLSNYEGRADTFLHELLHLDLAANSVNNNPNPQVRDLSIRYGSTNPTGPRWTKVYGPKLTKILARFLPISRVSTQTGYFIQRSDDNLVLFALANYVQSKLGYYPWLPLVFDGLTDAPKVPPNHQSTDPFIGYTSNGNNPVDFVNFTTADNGGARNLEDSGNCPTVLSTGSGEDLDIGAPNPTDAYPSSYWDQRTKWLQSLDGGATVDTGS
ncbi:hypothetical protein Egran_00162 [Elaphomyces granulatus]|uniref:Lysine-specific metallo-endopeptidase domain-containing protein n=1 Tax=Elaphomyces granulatus TaxID=519963 RepID=A0A232M6R5_9EURO|nr:hypothetical protein Egran_00162 [Elaphomyces granulatus]